MLLHRLKTKSIIILVSIFNYNIVKPQIKIKATYISNYNTVNLSIINKEIY